MDSVIRAFAIYAFLLLLFRIAGNRTLAETTTFDLVLLLIISEATQQAMVDDDHSFTNAVLLVTTLVSLNIGLSLLKHRFPAFDKWLDGLPVVLVENGRLLTDRMAKERVDEEDVLEAAHDKQGLERTDQIKYAILQRGGDISIVPKRDAR
jgi:uncharacterized membrane protein YcaP (DUF421 family)